ncbi:MAG: peptidylprolyl isomerase [Candidatus Kerfeldbacteria bacterium]
MKKFLFCILPAVLLVGAACSNKNTTMNTTNTTPISNPPGAVSILPAVDRTGKQVRIETGKGTIVFELFGTEAPIAVSSFITLTQKAFFNGLTFHRYEPEFVIQGGDPDGNGTGGPGYSFNDEKVVREYDAGIVAMANAGPNTNGSQFFIMLEDRHDLPKSYTIFGKVTKGMDVAQEIRAGEVMTKVSIEPLGT